MSDTDPIVIEGPEQSRVDTKQPDGGLPLLPGVRNIGVFRATRDTTDFSDGRGWTYHHHIDLACWKGRLYVCWNSCEKDEDVWPSRELYSTSVDGLTWTPPAELFPQGISTPLRMYFYLGGNGVMLAIAGMRHGTADTDEDTKEGLVVREIKPDHTLEDVFTLQPAGDKLTAPIYSTSSSAAFKNACEQLLADTVFLEQQDLGRLLGDRKMKWHNASAWPGGKVPGDNAKWVCGKAWSFYDRPGEIVGVSKMGFTTVSRDGGNTWSQPVVPATLVTGKAKVWTQVLPDGRYTLVYNPSRGARYPLAVVFGEDGMHYAGMRIVHGELPRQRYVGKFRSVGPQYTRGVSKWSNDGSREGEGCWWIVYSMSKEDIWVSRIPLKTVSIADETIGDLSTWNVYTPKWSSVSAGPIRLENWDPYDYARIQRVFSSRNRVTLELALQFESNTGDLEIDLGGDANASRPIRLRISGGHLYANSETAIAPIGIACKLTVHADADQRQFRATLDGREVVSAGTFADDTVTFSRVSLRTGPYRGLGGTEPVPAGSDRPTTPTVVVVNHMSIR